MANSLTTNPYSIDTAMTSSMKTNSGLPNGGMPIFITQVYWRDPLNIGDTVVLKDGTGTTILALRCEAANQSQIVPFVPPRTVSDFTVSAVDSGVVYISTF